jgi:hypothetical protein
MFDKSSIKYFPNLLSQLDGLLSFNCEVEKYLEAVDTVLKNGLYFLSIVILFWLPTTWGLCASVAGRRKHQQPSASQEYKQDVGAGMRR